MPKKLTHDDVSSRRLATCVQRFPNAEIGVLAQACCRFPKPCSPYGTMEAVEAGNLTEAGLEPPRKSMMEAMLETKLYTEKKVLEPMRVGSSFAIETKLMDELTPGDRQAAMDFELKRQRVRLETHILSEKLAEETYTDKKSYSTPKTWWDMFKMTYAMTWWLGWLVRKWPAEFDYHWFEVGVNVERFVQYPESDLPVPSLGRPIPYERVTRLTHQELEDLAAQRQLQDKRDEEDKRVVVYSLIPETFEELSDETGLPEQWFKDAYNYDQDFDLQSKIYIIPTGFGYDNK